MTNDTRSRLDALRDRERALIIADVQAVRKGIDAGGIHQELAAIRLEMKTIRRTLATKKSQAGKDRLDATIAVNVNSVVRDRLRALAASKAMTLSEYMRFLIDKHIASQAIDFSGGLRQLKTRVKWLESLT